MFLFLNFFWCFLNGTTSTAKSQRNSTANRSDSIKISCWKVPLIYFQVLMELHREVISCYHCKNHKWSASTIQQGCHWTAISSGDPAFVHHPQTFAHNSYYKKCVSLVDQNHTNLSAHVCTTFKILLWKRSQHLLPQLISPVKTIHVLMIFG